MTAPRDKTERADARASADPRASAERTDVRHSAERTDVRRSTERTGARHSAERADVRHSTESADSRHSAERADVRRSTESADSRHSAERADAPERGAAMERVRAVVAAGRRVADPTDPLGREARERLPETTRLSIENIELALREHLETDPTPADLATLVGRAGRAERCVAILSANVCTAALRAIAFACATAPEVLVKPSRRDPVLAELLVRALAEGAALRGAHGSIALADQLDLSPDDEVHVYGRDATIRSLRATLPGTTVRAHGTGFGIAVIEADGDVAQAAEGLARDAGVFDQRGCLSPRVALVAASPPDPLARARVFARALADALATFGQRVPRGQLDAQVLADLRRYVQTATALGMCIEGESAVVGLDEAPAQLVLPPEARAVHVMPATPEDATRWLSRWAEQLTAIGFAGQGPLADAVRRAAPHARFSAIGRMQQPPLDGPVDLRPPDA